MFPKSIIIDKVLWIISTPSSYQLKVLVRMLKKCDQDTIRNFFNGTSNHVEQNQCPPDMGMG